MSNSPDVIVIGGGVIGLSVARRLALDGVHVVLLERDAEGRAASWAGAGVLALPNPHRTDAVAQLHLRSLAMYPEFCRTLLDESGTDPEYDPCGELELAFREDALGVLRSDLEAAGGRRTPDGEPAFELLTPDDARRLEPLASPEIVGALLCHETAQVRNPRLLAALRASCARLGVECRQQSEVRALSMSAGRVTGVRTDAGAISCACVVLCAGPWSSQLDPRLETLMPVRPVRGQMVLMRLGHRPFRHVLSRGKTYWVPRRDGHVLLGATEEPGAGFDVRTTARGVAGLIEKGLRLAPSMADAPLVATWAGLRPGTPDDLPYLGPVPGFDGLIAATGHFRSGLNLAPATAEVVACQTRGGTFDIDLSIARPGRPVT